MAWDIYSIAYTSCCRWAPVVKSFICWMLSLCLGSQVTPSDEIVRRHQQIDLKKDTFGRVKLETKILAERKWFGTDFQWPDTDCACTRRSWSHTSRKGWILGCVSSVRIDCKSIAACIVLCRALESEKLQSA